MYLSMYTLKFLPGTKDYVLRDLMSKYPESKVVKVSEGSLIFQYKDNNIEIFRNLLSPTHIEDSSGRILNLSRRPWRKDFVSAGINPSLAYILCMIADLKSEDILLDPFCGSSTIPITGIKYFNIKKSISSDISGKAIDSSLSNFQKAGIPTRRYKLFKSDISELKLNKRNIDKIVSNLPFGIRVGSHDKNEKIYYELEKVAEKLLRKRGVLVLLTQEKTLLRKVFKNWKIESVLCVNEGGLLPEVFKIRRKS